MKKIKEICLICLVINIFLVVQLFCGSVIALNNSNEEPDIVGLSTNEIMPMMANSCYNYPTVNDCMDAISAKNHFTYEAYGNGYNCTEGYSVTITNAHDYLNVSLFYNGSCVDIFTCAVR